MFEALANKPVRLLWAGQVFSSVGDEIYNIAIVWYATQLIGTDAGYVASLQALAIFIFSLIGGVWVDHHDNRKVMITTDLSRGFAILILPLSSFFFPLSLWLLIPIAIVVASLSAFFNPALRALLPSVVEEQRILETANGLMESTSRFARAIGPGLIGLVSGFVPVVHYFTIDALTFFVSAWSVKNVEIHATASHEKAERSRFSESIFAGYHLSKKNSTISFIIYSGAIVGAAWMFVIPLGIALLLRERITSDVGALGTVIFGYGLGNVSSSIALTNFSFKRPARLIWWSHILAGIGFVGLAFCQTLPQAMIAGAIAASGGPMDDIGFVNLLQRYYRGRDLMRVHRYNMALNYGMLLSVLLLSPMLFKLVSVSHVILGCAAAIFIPGVIGYLYFDEACDAS
jgi:MFS family permease